MNNNDFWKEGVREIVIVLIIPSIASAIYGVLSQNLRFALITFMIVLVPTTFAVYWKYRQWYSLPIGIILFFLIWLVWRSGPLCSVNKTGLNLSDFTSLNSRPVPDNRSLISHPGAQWTVNVSPFEDNSSMDNWKCTWHDELSDGEIKTRGNCKVEYQAGPDQIADLITVEVNDANCPFIFYDVLSFSIMSVGE